MARRIAIYTVTDDGRDKGKQFQLTEMPADQGERWAMRALLAMTSAGVQIPDNVAEAGMAGIAAVGLKALSAINYDAAEPLLAEMFGCVQIVMPGMPPRPLLEGSGGDIEEIKTRIKLRVEVLKLHVDFSQAAAKLTTAPAAPGTGAA